MKLFKRFISLAICSTIAVFSFSGCNTLLGKRCRHGVSSKSGYDEQTHYSICNECGEKYDVDNHRMIMAYINGKQHFMKCQLCKYTDSYEPHDMTSWSLYQSYSKRKCATEGCKYEEACYHDGTTKYAVDGEEHYVTCEECKVNLTQKTTHTYDMYTDLTETTHSLICECGKASGEIVPHDLEYKCEKDSHWQACVCGYKTEEVACSYGDYVPEPDMHYKICSVCEGKGKTGTHSYELTDSKKRLCRDCSYEKRPYSLLLGTWQYYNYGTRKLTLSSDWSYTITNSSGTTIIEEGDYDVNYYTSLKGEINGTISLNPGGYINTTYINFVFKKGVTNKFTDKNNRTYTKN